MTLSKCYLGYFHVANAPDWLRAKENIFILMITFLPCDLQFVPCITKCNLTLYLPCCLIRRPLLDLTSLDPYYERYMSMRVFSLHFIYPSTFQHCRLIYPTLMDNFGIYRLFLMVFLVTLVVARSNPSNQNPSSEVDKKSSCYNHRGFNKDYFCTVGQALLI